MFTKLTSFNKYSWNPEPTTSTEINYSSKASSQALNLRTGFELQTGNVAKNLYLNAFYYKRSAAWYLVVCPFIFLSKHFILFGVVANSDNILGILRAFHNYLRLGVLYHRWFIYRYIFQKWEETGKPGEKSIHTKNKGGKKPPHSLTSYQFPGAVKQQLHQRATHIKTQN